MWLRLVRTLRTTWFIFNQHFIAFVIWSLIVKLYVKFQVDLGFRMLMIIGTLFSFQFTICSYVLKYLRNLPKKCVLLNIGISLRKMDNIFFTIIIYLKDIHRGTWGTPKARYSLKLYKTKGHVLPVFNSFLP